MPMVDVTDIILNEEAKELEELLKDPVCRAAHERFERECKLRGELLQLKKKAEMLGFELRFRPIKKNRGDYYAGGMERIHIR
jgi:hypothetical protein